MKYIVTLNNKRFEVEVTETEAEITSVTAAAEEKPFAPPPAPEAPAAQASEIDGTPVKAPMPGAVLEVRVNVGQSVKAGDVMFILEAMKMENEIVAPKDGRVKRIIAGKGASVDTDAVLAVI
ncbi:MAG: biotin/lipoyl-binding protein [Clostridia bacterium]|nr:biotin/lipoyl-binding protein [Clostridia bacterium]